MKSTVALSRTKSNISISYIMFSFHEKESNRKHRFRWMWHYLLIQKKMLECKFCDLCFTSWGFLSPIFEQKLPRAIKVKRDKFNRYKGNSIFQTGLYVLAAAESIIIVYSTIDHLWHPNSLQQLCPSHGLVMCPNRMLHHLNLFPQPTDAFSCVSRRTCDSFSTDTRLVFSYTVLASSTFPIRSRMFQFITSTEHSRKGKILQLPNLKSSLYNISSSKIRFPSLSHNGLFTLYVTAFVSLL